MIEVRHLSKHFGATVAVDDVSFNVSRGEVLGFLGPNGAGKSTTMRVLTGYIPPTSGSAHVAGLDLRSDSLSVRRRIGYLPESAPLYGDMEVIDFLRFIASVRGIPAGETTDRIGRMVRRCGLEKVIGRPIHHLSKGYRQRVGLAQAMIHDPDLLVLDEPTTGLDPNQIIEIRELIRELGREKTVILSTHILPEVEATCGRVLIINDGKIVASGTPGELAQGEGKETVHLSVRAPSREAVEEKLGTGELVEKVSWKGNGGEGIHRFVITGPSGKGLGEALFHAAVESGWTISELRPERANLEDVFHRLTRRDGP